MIEREDLFGKKCRIEVQNPAFQYCIFRIIASDIITKEWIDVPMKSSVPVEHDHEEEIAFVIWDGFITDASTILRVPLKDIEILED